MNRALELSVRDLKLRVLVKRDMLKFGVCMLGVQGRASCFRGFGRLGLRV